jgi:hypothetical protein
MDDNSEFEVAADLTENGSL